MPLNGPSRYRPESCPCAETRSPADVFGRFSALGVRRGITRSSLAHLVDRRTTVVSLIAGTRLSELRGLAFVVGICRRAKRPTRYGATAKERAVEALYFSDETSNAAKTF